MKPKDPIKDLQKQIDVLSKQFVKLQKDVEALKPEVDTRTDDELYKEAVHIVRDAGKASASYIQRKLKIGYARSARLMDTLEERGVIGAANREGVRVILKK